MTLGGDLPDETWVRLAVQWLLDNHEPEFMDAFNALDQVARDRGVRPDYQEVTRLAGRVLEAWTTGLQLRR